MNIVDMIIITIICFCMIRGIFRGISSELSSIIAVFSGFYGAYLFHPRLVEHLPRQAELGQYADMISFALLFCAVFVAVSLLGLLIKYALGITMLGWVDRLLGAGFGAVKGVLISSILLFVLVTMVGFRSPEVKQSLLSRYAIIISRRMTTITSQPALQKLKIQFEELQQLWQKRKP